MTFCHKFVLEKIIENVVQLRWIHRARSIHRDTNLSGSTVFPRRRLVILSCLITMIMITNTNQFKFIQQNNPTFHHAFPDLQQFLYHYPSCIHLPTYARMSGSGHHGHYNAAVHRASRVFLFANPWTTHALYYCMCMHEYRWPLDYAHAQLQYVDNIKWRYTKPKIYLLFSEVIAEVGSPSTGQNPPSRSLMVLGTVFNHFVWFTFLQNRCKFQ